VRSATADILEAAMSSDDPPSTTTPPEAHVALVRGAFAAFERRDLAGMQALCTPEVAFASQTARIGAAGETYLGHRGLAQYFNDTERIWETLELSPTEFREPTVDFVLVKGRVRAWGSGRVVDSSASWLFRLSGGRIAEIRAFDTADAATAYYVTRAAAAG
jgi:ketosteroid isomerase-like protein